MASLLSGAFTSLQIGAARMRRYRVVMAAVARLCGWDFTPGK